MLDFVGELRMQLPDHLTAKPLSLSNSLWLLSTWTCCTWHGARLPIPPKLPLLTRKAVCSFLSKNHISPPPTTLPVTGGSSPPEGVTPTLVLKVSCWQQRSGCCNLQEHSQVSPTWEGDEELQWPPTPQRLCGHTMPPVCPCQRLLCGVGPSHPPWLTVPPAPPQSSLS